MNQRDGTILVALPGKKFKGNHPAAARFVFLPDPQEQVSLRPNLGIPRRGSLRWAAGSGALQFVLVKPLHESALHVAQV